jgi:hypothetical protein
VIITSVAMLVVAFALLVVGALNGSTTMLGMSLGAAGAAGLCLFLGNASARRIAVARGVPIESVLAARMRRPAAEANAAEANGDGDPPKPPPIDGYDEMSAGEVTRLVSSGVMAEEDLSEMLVYEASHRRRRAVLTALMDVVGPDPRPDAEQPEQPEQTEQTSVAGSVRQRLRGGRPPSGTGPAAEALRTARQTTLTKDEEGDDRFARPDPG